MRPLYSLLHFLKEKKFKKEALFLEKIAVDIEEEELREKISDANQERKSRDLFDYSNIFPENKEYIVIPDEYAESSTEDNSYKDMVNHYNSVSEHYRSLGMERSLSEFNSDPGKVVILGEEFNLFEDLNKIGIKIYSNIVVTKVRSIFRQNFIHVEDIIKNKPMLFLERQNTNTVLELKNDIKDSSLFLSSPSEFFNSIQPIFENNNFVIEEESLEVIHTEINSIIDLILNSIEKIMNIIQLIPEFSSEEKMNYSSFGEYFSRYKVIISYDAQDISTASYSGGCDGVSWHSCRDIRDDLSILEDIIGGGMIAYLVNSENPYPVKSPLARIRIRHFAPSEDGAPNSDFILEEEKRVYSNSGLLSRSDVDLFRVIVQNWVKKTNSKINNNHIRYALSGDQYSDSLSKTKVNIGFEGFEGKRLVSRKSFDKFFYDFEYGSYRDLSESEIDKEHILVQALLGKRYSIEDIEGAHKDNYANKSELNLENETFIEGVTSSILKSPAGRSFSYKLNNYSWKIEEKDIDGIFKKINELYDLLLSNIFQDIDGANFANVMEFLIHSIFDKIGGINNDGGGLPFSVRNKLKEKVDKNILYNLKRITSDIKNTDSLSKVKKKISILNDLFGYYGDDKLNDIMDSVYSKIINLNKESHFGSLYSEISSLSTIAMQSLLKNDKVKESLSDEINAQEPSRFYSKEESFAENLEGYPRDTIRMLNKIKPVAGHLKEFSFLMNISKKYMYDSFEVEAESQDAAIESLVNKFPIITKEALLSKYNILKIEEAPETFKIFEIKKGFYFKKKRLYGGADQYYLARRFSRYMMGEKALKYIALSIGLSEKNVSKSFGQWNISSRILI